MSNVEALMKSIIVFPSLANALDTESQNDATV